jgi:PRTRC genetic system protein B
MNQYLTNTRLIPRRAIIVYERAGQWSNDYYLEDREIKNQGGKYVFMAPVPLSHQAMRGIASSFIKKNALEMDFGGLVAQHLLLGINRPGICAVMWYRPAETRKLNFSGHLKIKGESTVQIPATLYLVFNDNLYLFALSDSKRPSGKSKLFNAPFFNIYADGRVCLGTAPVGKIRAKTFEGEAARFERAFYMAEQNGGTQNPCKTPLERLWNGLIKNKGPFPTKKELIPQAKFKTIDELIGKLIGNAKTNDQEEEDFDL